MPFTDSRSEEKKESVGFFVERRKRHEYRPSYSVVKRKGKETRPKRN